MKKYIFILSMVLVILLLGSAQEFVPTKDPSLIAYFSFDGNFKEARGKLPDATITGTKIGAFGARGIEFKDGVKGQCAYFPGNRGLILPENLIKDYDYTVSFWLNAETFTMHTTTFFGVYIDERGAFYWVSFVPYGWNKGTLLWARNDKDDIWYDGLLSENLELNKWYHVAIVVNKGKAQIYLNGKQVLEKVQINGQPNPEGLVPDVFSIKPGGTFALGVNYWDPPFRGMIDELMIFDRSLSASEVKVLAQK